jgi:hypothetical protein
VTSGAHAGRNTSESRDPAHEVLRIPFALTRKVRDPKSAIRRLRCGEHDGAPTWSFDVVFLGAYVSGTHSTAQRYSAAVVALPWRVEGRIGITRRGFFRTPQLLVAPELEAGTRELHRRFTVRGTSPELGALLDDHVCAWLTGPGRGFHYEIVHDRVLAYGWRRYLGGNGPLKAAIGLAVQLREHAHGESR